MSNIIRLRETAEIEMALQILQQSKYSTLDKTEIIKALIAKEAYEIELKNNIVPTFKKLNFTELDKLKIKKSIQNSQSIGKKWLKSKGYDPDTLTEDELNKIIDSE
jgi:hypothetical protein